MQGTPIPATRDSIMNYLPSINRMALIVRPKQPFIDWVKSQDPDFEPLEERHDAKSAYLLPEAEVCTQGVSRGLMRDNRKNFYAAANPVEIFNFDIAIRGYQTATRNSICQLPFPSIE